MQTLEQIIANCVSGGFIIGFAAEEFDKVRRPQVYQETLDKLSRLRQDTVLQIKQLIKEKSNA